MAEGTEVARVEPGMGVAPQLAQLGIQIETDASGRYRQITYPPQLREAVNVLLPVMSIAQADPNFTPSLRVVELDMTGMEKAGPHVYKQGKDRYALTKQALEVLGHGAGLLEQRSGRVSREDLEDDEIGYWGQVKIRRADGTVELIRREKIVSKDVLKHEIMEQVDSLAVRYPNDWNETRVLNEKKKRWLTEREHMHAKTESKAVLRAIRAALQIPHVFSEAQIKKPFLVVGYAFTPDWDDPVVKKLLVEHALGGGAAQLYGTAADSVDEGDVDQSRQLDRTILAPVAEIEPGPRDPDPDEQPEPEPVPAPTPGFTGAEPGASDEPEPEDAPSEPEPEPEAKESLQKRAYDKACGVALADDFGTKYPGKTFAEIALDGESGLAYIAWVADAANDERLKAAATAYLAGPGEAE